MLLNQWVNWWNLSQNSYTLLYSLHDWKCSKKQGNVKTSQFCVCRHRHFSVKVIRSISFNGKKIFSFSNTCRIQKFRPFLQKWSNLSKFSRSSKWHLPDFDYSAKNPRRPKPISLIRNPTRISNTFQCTVRWERSVLGVHVQWNVDVVQWQEVGPV